MWTEDSTQWLPPTMSRSDRIGIKDVFPARPVIGNPHGGGLQGHPVLVLSSRRLVADRG